MEPAIGLTTKLAVCPEAYGDMQSCFHEVD